MSVMLALPDRRSPEPYPPTELAKSVVKAWDLVRAASDRVQILEDPIVRIADWEAALSGVMATTNDLFTAAQLWSGRYSPARTAVGRRLREAIVFHVLFANRAIAVGDFPEAHRALWRAGVKVAKLAVEMGVEL